MAIRDDTRPVLAVMCDVGFGCRDNGRPGLWFEADTGDGAALQVLFGAAALAIIEQSGVYDVRDLEGRTCWVDRTPGTITFRELTAIAPRRRS